MNKARLLVFAGLLPLLSVPAYAGGWQIQYTASGSDTHDGDDNGGEQTSPRAWDIHPIGGVAQGWNWYDGTDRYTHNASQSTSNGTVDCTFTWIPATGKDLTTDPPPSELNLIEYTRVGAFDAQDGYGFMDERTEPTISVEEPKNATSIPHPKGKEYKARNLRSFPVPPDGVVHLTQKSFNVSCSTPDPDDNSIQPATRVQYSWVQDTRSLSLSRYGAHNERVDGDTTHGDTTYSYRAFNNTNSFVNKTNTQNFIASVYGGWTQHEIDNGYGNPPVVVKGTDHQWSPESDHPKGSDSWREADYDMPLGNMSKPLGGVWQGLPTGQGEKQITYTVKDNRNNEGEVTAEKKYVLHIHDPVELSSQTTSRETVNVVLRRGNGATIDTPSQPGGVKAGSVAIETGVSSSQGVAVGASFDISEFISFLGLDFQYSVQNETSSATSATLSQDVPEGQYCYAMVTHVYERVHQYLYKYDAGGRNVRMGRAAEGDDGHNITREVPHEAFADKYLHPTTPFWSNPIDQGDFAPTPDSLPPYESTYTS